MNTIGKVGFFGKLPVVGDFVSRRLPKEFVVPWDSWLQSGLATSREQLGDDWLKVYLNSPIWRFVLSPSICGDKAVAGIVMPSVDKVGRYFPLTVALVFEHPPALPHLFTAGNVWFEQLEDAAIAGLETKLDMETFNRLVQRLPTFVLPDSTGKGLGQQQQAWTESMMATGMVSFNPITETFTDLNAELLTHFISGYSLWSNVGSETGRPVLLSCKGLPPIGCFSNFFKRADVGHQEKERTEDEAPVPFNLALKEPTPVSLTLSQLLASDACSLPTLTWRSWALTDTGKQRKNNEDALLNKPEAGLWVVADGMGGHRAGEVASQLIAQALDGLAVFESMENYVNALEIALHQVNSALRQLRIKQYENRLVGSTVVALACLARQCAILWVGDSRVYRFRNQQLQLLTQDHCCIDDVSIQGGMKKNNAITRAVGGHDELEIDLAMAEVMEGDIFLLCSDGLDKEISFKDIEHIMQACAPHDIAQSLVNEALARGARDNVTVIVVTTENSIQPTLVG